jgi:hypothetical protein
MLCNREIKIEIAEQFLRARFGDKRFSAAQFADVMFLVAGTHGMQEGMIALGAPRKKALGDYCASTRKAFGPGGATIPGLID